MKIAREKDQTMKTTSMGFFKLGVTKFDIAKYELLIHPEQKTEMASYYSFVLLEVEFDCK